MPPFTCWTVVPQTVGSVGRGLCGSSTLWPAVARAGSPWPGVLLSQGLLPLWTMTVASAPVARLCGLWSCRLCLCWFCGPRSVALWAAVLGAVAPFVLWELGGHHCLSQELVLTLPELPFLQGLRSPRPPSASFPTGLRAASDSTRVTSEGTVALAVSADASQLPSASHHPQPSDLGQGLGAERTCPPQDTQEPLFPTPEAPPPHAQAVWQEGTCH